MSKWQEDLENALEKEAEREDIIEEKRKKEREVEIRKQTDMVIREFYMEAVSTAFRQVKSMMEKHKDIEISIPDGRMRGESANFIVYEKGTRQSGNMGKEFHYIIRAEISPSEITIESSYYICLKHHNDYHEGQIQSVKDHTTISVDDICKDITHGYKMMVDKALENQSSSP